MRYLMLILLFSNVAFAEYRAHELIIRNTESGTERRAVSTLDHMQYAEYYPIGRAEVVELATSWRCWGRTSNFKKICPNPNGQDAAPKPNSEPDRVPSAAP